MRGRVNDEEGMGHGASRHRVKRAERKTVAIVTGTRAEFGLLRPVIDAVRAHRGLRLKLIAAGSHFLPPARTIREVEAAYAVAARVLMQRAGRTGRHEDALATARGVEGFARAFAKIKPDWVVVLGDRIEAFAAASAASIAGIGVCHIHGGDRAEGIADEALRHAITKLAHLHCAATLKSARRIISMGERRESVHVTGSPAIDGLDRLAPLTESEFEAIGRPRGVVLMHPSGDEAADRAFMRGVFDALVANVIDPALVLAPNADSGREVILDEIRRRMGERYATTVHFREHLPRSVFVRMLRMNPDGFVVIGNSSAGLIECAALGVRVVNLGHRQRGREQAKNVVNVPEPDGLAIMKAVLKAARYRNWHKPGHPFGDGRAGPRIADLLAKTDPAGLLRKRNTS